MKVALVQTELAWQDQAANRKKITELIENEDSGADLFVLPEMFSTGFTMEPGKYAEPALGGSFRMMQTLAGKKNAAITGSISTVENGACFNRLYWVFPDGSHEQYDKRHLFSMGKEDQHYTAGNKKIIVEFRGWKICPLICYDLRFPVWSRNRLNNGEHEYDLLIYVANWPAVRSYAWKHLLIARAIENQCYVVAVNRIGKDGNQFEHEGESVVIDPKGATMLNLLSKPGIGQIELVRGSLVEFRQQFPAGSDADQFAIV